MYLLDHIMASWKYLFCRQRMDQKYLSQLWQGIPMLGPIISSHQWEPLDGPLFRIFSKLVQELDHRNAPVTTGLSQRPRFRCTLDGEQIEVSKRSSS